MSSVHPDAARIYALLLAYTPKNEQEQSDREQMLQYLQKGNAALTRDDLVAHFTASAWVCSKDRSRILMAYHNIYKAWAWLGGHADGDDDLQAVARREAQEETGVQHLRLLQEEPVSIEVLTVAPHIKRGKFVSGHLHFNITYLYEADYDDALSVKEDENSAVGWRECSRVIPDCNEEQMVPIYQKLMERMLQL